MKNVPDCENLHFAGAAAATACNIIKVLLLFDDRLLDSARPITRFCFNF